MRENLSGFDDEQEYSAWILDQEIQYENDRAQYMDMYDSSMSEIDLLKEYLNEHITDNDIRSLLARSKGLIEAFISKRVAELRKEGFFE